MADRSPPHRHYHRTASSSRRSRYPRPISPASTGPRHRLGRPLPLPRGHPHLHLRASNHGPAPPSRPRHRPQGRLRSLPRPHRSGRRHCDHHDALAIARCRLVGSSRSILWQKEALINWALSRLPDSVRYVAWLDHDLIFDRPDRPDWLAKAAARINGGAYAVQLFDRIRYLDRDGTTLYEPRRRLGPRLRRPAQLRPRRRMDGLASLAPINRRPLYSANVVGGGDATFFAAVTKCDYGHARRQTPRLRDHALQYIDRIGSPRWDYVPGLVTHLLHGDASNRQYITRDEILRRHDFDPLRHIATNPITVLLEWTDAAPPALITDVRSYFTNRREDET